MNSASGDVIPRGRDVISDAKRGGVNIAALPGGSKVTEPYVFVAEAAGKKMKAVTAMKEVDVLNTVVPRKPFYSCLRVRGTEALPSSPYGDNQGYFPKWNKLMRGKHTGQTTGNPFPVNL